MKKISILLVLSLLSFQVSWAQIEVNDIQVDQIEAEPLVPTAELEYEMQLAAETNTQQKEDTLIPKQPPVEVFADPLDFFESDAIKDQRQGQEMLTEQQILEQLEADRLDAEKRRTNGYLNRSSAPAVEPYRDSPDSWYVTGTFGSTEYDTIGIDTNQTLGIAVGTRIFNKFIFEGSLSISKYFIEERASDPYWTIFKKMDQYNVAMAVKVPLFEGQIFNGRVMPEVGVIASYTRRSFEEQSFNNNLIGVKDSTSNAFDMGFSMGVDFNVTRSFALGVDYKYFFNLSDGGNSDFYAGNGGAQRIDPIEEINYHQLGVNGKFKF